MPAEAAHGAEQNGSARVSFSDLVRAHHELAGNGGSAPSEAEHRFQGLLRAFEESSGPIVEAYWCRKEASAVALTRRERQLRGRLLPRRRTKLEYRLHRVSDWVTDETHEIADLLHDCDILAIKASHGLEGVPRAVVMQWLLLVESHLLGFIERHRDRAPDPAEAKRFADNERAELKRIEDYYFRAGEKRARMRYVEGMLGPGVLMLLASALATAVVLSLFGVLDLASPDVREFYASVAAGGIGAVISVLMRMSGRGSFVIDHELARLDVILVGAYRPLIGAVSGIVVYFIVQTPFVPVEDSALTFPLFVVISFLAGFSERWTRMVLSGAMRTIGDRVPSAEEAPAPAKEPVEAPPVAAVY